MIQFVEEFKQVPSGKCVVKLNESDKDVHEGLWWKCPETGNMLVAIEDHTKVVANTAVFLLLDDKEKDASYYRGVIAADGQLNTY